MQKGGVVAVVLGYVGSLCLVFSCQAWCFLSVAEPFAVSMVLGLCHFEDVVVSGMTAESGGCMAAGPTICFLWGVDGVVVVVVVVFFFLPAVLHVGVVVVF